MALFGYQCEKVEISLETLKIEISFMIANKQKCNHFNGFFYI